VRFAEDEYTGKAGPWKGVGYAVDDRRAGAAQCRAEGCGNFFRPELRQTFTLREIDRVERGRDICIHPLRTLAESWLAYLFKIEQWPESRICILALLKFVECRKSGGKWVSD